MTNQKNRKILIVDDDSSFVDSSETILKTKGFDVAKAANAETAFEALSTEKPDLVLLDVNLPDKNGFEVLRAMKKSKNFMNTPVILITGDMTVQIDKGFSEGADDCIFKPINMEKLVASINRLLK